MLKETLIDKFKIGWYGLKANDIVYDYCIINNVCYIDLYIALNNGKFVFYKSLGVWSEPKMCILEEERIESIVDYKERMELMFRKK